MIWVLIRKLFRRPRQPSDGNGVAAKKMADRRLAEAKRRWPEVEEARDLLATWIEDALRGHR